MTTKKAPAKAKVNTSRNIVAPATAAVDVSSRASATTGQIAKAPLAAAKTVSEAKPAAAPTREQIAIRAYEIYMGRGQVAGHELEDWAQAERELTTKSGRNLNN